ncbi:hypothetical protein EJ04DRAFT_27159 [Polyplosphaeria fusca]|uniref:Uncharacterized protein n=1 Tax=Polyplosphaeria fusca TaxID=682080 RepID=A0A9P4R3T1_9PLEO|nr:hypothetical protein EJ04DRAFT_27159 [Polyplosphaeria fusca]
MCMNRTARCTQYRYRINRDDGPSQTNSWPFVEALNNCQDPLLRTRSHCAPVAEHAHGLADAHIEAILGTSGIVSTGFPRPASPMALPRRSTPLILPLPIFPPSLNRHPQNPSTQQIKPPRRTVTAHLMHINLASHISKSFGKGYSRHTQGSANPSKRPAHSAHHAWRARRFSSGISGKRVACV